MLIPRDARGAGMRLEKARFLDDSANAIHLDTLHPGLPLSLVVESRPCEVAGKNRSLNA